MEESLKECNVLQEDENQDKTNSIKSQSRIEFERDKPQNLWFNKRKKKDREVIITSLLVKNKKHDKQLVLDEQLWVSLRSYGSYLLKQ